MPHPCILLSHPNSTSARSADRYNQIEVVSAFPLQTSVRRFCASVRARVRAARIEHAGSIQVGDIALPPGRIRLGGHNFTSDHDFVVAAKRDASRLVERFDVRESSRVLDIGCGVGRLAIGLKLHLGHMPRYTGIDLDSGCIGWCNRHLAEPGVRFVRINVANERYNPLGKPLSDGSRLPFPSASFDVVHLYSVFSHMRSQDVRVYLHEIRRLLAPSGRVFLTAFIEDGVEDEAINPPGYGLFPGEWQGALHCVRFSRGFFGREVEVAGLDIEDFDHASDTDGQSAVILRPA